MSRSPRSDSAADGVVLLDKSAGTSSRKAAAQVARQLGSPKFGHAGTLDPFASGLLVVLLGRACRTQDWFTLLPKEYEASARLGAVSTTGDPEGEITETGRLPESPLRLPTGKVRQRPPAFSAVHVDGRRAYERARAGEKFDIPEREVELYEFTEAGRRGDLVELRIACSSGTYVRSLVSDLGDAYTAELRRTAIGPFRVQDADPGRVLSINEALTFMSKAFLDPDSARAATHGRPVDPVTVREPAWEGPNGPPEEILLVDDDGAIAIARRDEGGRLKPVVGFRQ